MNSLPLSLLGAGIVTLIPGIPGQQTVVYSLYLRATGVTTITLLNGVIPLTGPLEFTNGADCLLPETGRYPLFTCSPGVPFAGTKTGTPTLGGIVWFLQG